MGGMDDTILISFKSGRTIKNRLVTSRSGRHGERYYMLYPAKYLMYKIKSSNSGKTDIEVSVLQVNPDGTMQKLQTWTLMSRSEVILVPEALPDNIRNLLALNEENLPGYTWFKEQLKSGEDNDNE